MYKYAKENNFKLKLENYNKKNLCSQNCLLLKHLTA